MMAWMDERKPITWNRTTAATIMIRFLFGRVVQGLESAIDGSRVASESARGTASPIVPLEIREGAVPRERPVDV
jgi:hypothetical protein